MNANNQQTSFKKASRLPEQDINCWIFSNMIEEILNADDQDDPLSDIITEWADAAWKTSTMDWIFDNPTETIHIIWPCRPEGRDNQRLHQFYNYWKRRYLEDHPEVRLGTKPKIGSTGKPQPETDPQRMNNSNSSIALAQACRQKWQTIGQMHKRG